jgi:hypothetical protein
MRPALITHQIHRSGTKGILLFALFWLSIGYAPLSHACTVFKVTHNGRTLIGNNEDAWSINSQVRFVQGHNGDYGAIYFDHFNGHPFRKMGPQLGMNEAGLVFDGLTIQPKHATPVPGRRQVHFDDLMPLLMRTCATVHEAATLMRAYDFSWLTRSMLFFADRNGDYLIVENDTMMFGNDPTYAVGNWRMGTCSDPDAIPIPRLQTGRALLAEGTTTSVAHGTAVLQSMIACRPKLGEGTIFSALFDPQQGEVHLFFYHDFEERVTFNLKDEFAKGDRTLEMASLFGTRPEYERLKNYITPFHQHWLFWSLVVLAAALAVLAAISAFVFLRRLITNFRQRTSSPLLPSVLSMLASGSAIVLTAILLTNESVFYFGLGNASVFVAYMPLVLAAIVIGLAALVIKDPERREWGARAVIILLLPFIGLLGHWGMWWP